jgi:hypothetical protein
MHFTVVLALLAMACGEPHRDDMAYAILDAVKLPLTARQPTWIALRGRPGGGLVHVAAGNGIVALQPGRYSIDHIDFGQNWRRGPGTVFLQQKVNFKVARDSVTYIGLLQIGPTRIRHDRPDWSSVELIPSEDIVSWACHCAADILRRLPIRWPDAGGSERFIRARCETQPGLRPTPSPSPPVR